VSTTVGDARGQTLIRPGVGSGVLRQEELSVPIVTVQQSPRDLDAKRRLVAGITQAFVDAYGVPGEHVQVFIAEFDHEHWAKAGVLAADAAA
jgi:4-oxalocrotonate tautomerase